MYDKELLKKGDLKQFKLFYKSTHQKIYSTALKLGLKHDDSLDVIQEAYVMFWKQLKQLDLSKSPEGLLKTITKRVIYKKMYHPGSQKEFFNENFILNHQEPINEAVEKPVHLTLLPKAIESLPVKQKKIIQLFYFEGLDTEEIATHLDVSKRTVENQMYRAKKKLKTLLKQDHLFYSIIFFIFIMSVLKK